ncbi:hypothetical protein Ate01nite_45160 [Actinoplanes teichomyceticus]|nr:hypothetical protein Ate01nite_45160 [Actinoplanes teichomyceticus]
MSTHQFRKNPQGVAAANMMPVKAEASAIGPSRRPSRTCAMEVAALRTETSDPYPTESSTHNAIAWAIQPTDVNTCSQTVRCRHRFVTQ